MEIKIKKAGIECIETLVDLRVEFIKDIHPDYDIELLKKIRNATRYYLQYLIDKNLYIGYLGFINNEIACCAGLLIYFLPPLNAAQSRKIGHVLNFYTRPEFRKKGYGLKLMEYIKSTAIEDEINRLMLNATSMGFPLYKKAGFIEPIDRAMQLDL